MKLSEKLRFLREIEGDLRGLGRALTQGELLRALRSELGESISQSYLSQIETGTRPHLTNTSRLLLARFFKVHPGFLVDDPEGYHAELMSEALFSEHRLDNWLLAGAERFRADPLLHAALVAVAQHPESRRLLLLLESLAQTPGAIETMSERLDPAASALSLPLHPGLGQKMAATQDDTASLDGDMQ